jgi:uncharacterized BrkB/YihY/UPF0761 family membrane protein
MKPTFLYTILAITGIVVVAVVAIYFYNNQSYQGTAITQVNPNLTPAQQVAAIQANIANGSVTQADVQQALSNGTITQAQYNQLYPNG